MRFLTDYSNIGVPGKWLYRVGPLGYEENIADPESVHSTSAEWDNEQQTCAISGRMKCHIKSTCSDQPDEGFCCVCQEGYYGNGYNCLKNDAPLRVTGSAKGLVNGLELDSQFQSYVILVDGRSYSALSPLPESIGALFQLLPKIGEPIGWLLAKPADGRPNGYQLTGGVFNQTTNIHFESGHKVQINYQFKGLNAYDQLTVDIEINGDIPDESLSGGKVKVQDAVDTYFLREDNTLTLSTTRTLETPERPLTYTVTEEIKFETCPYKPLEIVDNQLMLRVFKTSVSYEPRDQALRVNMLSKVGDFTEGVNPCNEGAICGENSFCIPAPTSEIGYECECKHGYFVGGIQNGVSYCVDINECASPSDNICDINAHCINVAGGYTCACQEGYRGTGYECNPEEPEEPYEQEQDNVSEEQRPTTNQPREPEDDCTDESCNYVPPEQGPGESEILKYLESSQNDPFPKLSTSRTLLQQRRMHLPTRLHRDGIWIHVEMRARHDHPGGSPELEEGVLRYRE